MSEKKTKLEQKTKADLLKIAKYRGLDCNARTGKAKLLKLIKEDQEPKSNEPQFELITNPLQIYEGTSKPLIFKEWFVNNEGTTSLIKIEVSRNTIDTDIRSEILPQPPKPTKESNRSGTGEAITDAVPMTLGKGLHPDWVAWDKKVEEWSKADSAYLINKAVPQWKSKQTLTEGGVELIREYLDEDKIEEIEKHLGKEIDAVNYKEESYEFYYMLYQYLHKIIITKIYMSLYTFVVQNCLHTVVQEKINVF
jgi:hypothetical protein